MNGVATGWIALAVAVIVGAVWFRRAHAVALPENRGGFVAAMAAAALIGVAAFVQGAGWLGGVPAALAVLFGAFFLLTVAISAQKGGPGRFEIGRPLPEFAAPDENGKLFEIASPAGNPLLLKFFRGHW